MPGNTRDKVRRFAKAHGRDLAAALVLASGRRNADQTLVGQMSHIVLREIGNAVSQLQRASFPADLTMIYESAAKEGVRAELLKSPAIAAQLEQPSFQSNRRFFCERQTMIGLVAITVLIAVTVGAVLGMNRGLTSAASSHLPSTIGYAGGRIDGAFALADRLQVGFSAIPVATKGDLPAPLGCLLMGECIDLVPKGSSKPVSNDATRFDSISTLIRIDARSVAAAGKRMERRP